MDLPRHWMPLVEIDREKDFSPIRPEIVAECVRSYGVTEEKARELLAMEHARSRFFVNAIYQVQVQDHGSQGITHLNIRRRDGGMIKDWRHFQQIKNEICGPEREAVEIYPAESRKVDATNKWHLWVLPEGMKMPFGFTERDVNYTENRDVPGMRQRPL